MRALFYHVVFASFVYANESAMLILLETSTKKLPTVKMIQEASDADSRALEHAYEALRTSDPRMVPAWPSALFSIAVLSRTDEERRNAVRLLEEILSEGRPVPCFRGKSEADAAQCRQLENDPDALNATAGMKAVVPRSLGLLARPDRVVPVTDALRALERTIRDSRQSESVRLEAVSTLMRDGSEAARAVLKRIADDSSVDNMIRNQAHAAIQRMPSNPRTR